MYYYVNKSCKLVFIYIPTKLVSMQNAIEVRKDNFHHSRTFLVWMWQQSSDRYASCLLVCFVLFLVLFFGGFFVHCLSCYCFVLFCFLLCLLFCFALFVFGQHWSVILRKSKFLALKSRNFMVLATKNFTLVLFILSISLILFRIYIYVC